jgi:hypothetical protein
LVKNIKELQEDLVLAFTFCFPNPPYIPPSSIQHYLTLNIRFTRHAADAVNCQRVAAAAAAAAGAFDFFFPHSTLLLFPGFERDPILSFFLFLSWRLFLFLFFIFIRFQGMVFESFGFQNATNLSSRRFL